MISRSTYLPGLVVFVALFSVTLFNLKAQGQVLFTDNFDSIVDGNTVNPSAWRVPFTGDGSFLGRTQLETDNAKLATVSNPTGTAGVAVLELNTFILGNDGPGGNADAFLGAEMITKGNYNLGGGLVFKSRMRLSPTGTGPGGSIPTPNGLVGAGFLYDVKTLTPTPLVRDEIDFELLTNEANGAERLFTNSYNDVGFTGGSGDAGFGSGTVDMFAFQDYEVVWTPTKVDYKVNGAVVRTVTGAQVPDDPMGLRFNLWGPESGFSQAYDASLVPDTSAANNRKFTLEVDSTSIERINTTASANLLSNQSFEDLDLFGFPDIVDASNPGSFSISNGTGKWVEFNENAVENPLTIAPPDQFAAQDGTLAAKLFSPFQANNASGYWQNVGGVSEGDELSASIWARAPSADDISGGDPVANQWENFARIDLQFLDEFGNVIGSVAFSPGENEKDTPIFDGRDPLLLDVQDEWIKYGVEAKAPANAEFVRYNLFFNSALQSESGSIWFDNAELVKLTASAPTGDFDEDLDVDGVDFLEWQRGNDGTPAGLTAWQTNYGNGTLASAISVVPEPTTTLMICIGTCIAVVRRKVKV